MISVTQPLGADANDPAAFLSESVHEIFDEYYSVSLSFWTKMGLREKARQGLLTGSLPWGYVKGTDDIATPDPEKAPYVRQLFEMYAAGQHTDRTLAVWLNVNEQRTTRGRSFGADTVREMLCNAAYAGFVSARRDTSKAIKGVHEPIVEEALFDRVQQMRRQRARTLRPGRPSPRYILRGLAHCRRCHARMQGTTGGRELTARYYCASRRANRSCDQPIAQAEKIERQLVQFITGFAPGHAVRQEVLRRLAASAAPRQPKPSSAAQPWRSACAGHATSTSSETYPAPNTSRDATPSTPSWPSSRRNPSPTSTKHAPCSKTLRSSGRTKPTRTPSATSCTSSSTASGSRTAASSLSNPSHPSCPSSSTKTQRRKRG